MHRIFQTSIDSLSESANAGDLRVALSQVADALDLRCFAYLSVPDRAGANVGLISSYPREWTSHYVERHYERLDPVIAHALGDTEPFEWGPEVGPTGISKAQQTLFEQAAEFGIRYGSPSRSTIAAGERPLLPSLSMNVARLSDDA